jgi:hypothetical protein
MFNVVEHQIGGKKRIETTVYVHGVAPAVLERVRCTQVRVWCVKFYPRCDPCYTLLSSCLSRLTNNSLHLLDSNEIIMTLHPRNDTRLPPTAASLCSQGGSLAWMGMIATGHDGGNSKQRSPK